MEGDLFKLLIESSADGYALFMDGELKYLSPSYMDILGYSETGLKLEDILARIHPEDAPMIFNEIEMGRKNHLKMQKYKFRALHKNGHYIWLQDVIKREFHSDGTEARVMINTRDISELMESQENLSTALNENRLLFGELQHRVKNNLSMISSMLELETHKLKDETVKKIVRNNSERIKTLVALYEILYSKNEISSVNIQDYLDILIQNEISNFEPISKDIQLKLNVENIKINLDFAIKIGIILHELIVNSIKHGFPKTLSFIPKAINIDFGINQKREIELKYSDNGIGLPEKILKEKKYGFGLNLINTFLSNYKNFTLSNLNPGMFCLITLRTEDSLYAKI